MQLAKERKERMTTLKSQVTTKLVNINNVNDDMYVNRNYARNNSREEYKRLRGRSARRREKYHAISDTLRQVHKPWRERSTEDVVSDAGTILFDLT